MRPIEHAGVQVKMFSSRAFKTLSAARIAIAFCTYSGSVDLGMLLNMCKKIEYQASGSGEMRNFVPPYLFVMRFFFPHLFCCCYCIFHCRLAKTKVFIVFAICSTCQLLWRQWQNISFSFEAPIKTIKRDMNSAFAKDVNCITKGSTPVAANQVECQ